RERGAAGELLQREHVDDGQVVVACHADGAVAAGELDGGVGFPAVADEVAEAPELLGALALGGVDHGLERVAVPVYVSCDGDLHGGVSSIRCRSGSAFPSPSWLRWWWRKLPW